MGGEAPEAGPQVRVDAPRPPAVASCANGRGPDRAPIPPPGAPRPPPRFGHGQSLRLRRSKDFRRVQGKGRRLRAGQLLCLWLAGQADASRVGLTVSKKVGNAVVRNRVKRWLREGVRHERHRLPGRVDLVLIPHPDAATAGARALRADVAALFDAAAQQAAGRRRR